MRHVATTLLFGPALTLAPACFDPPSDPVMFACEYDGAGECPGGYECRIDGCCHHEDTPDDDAVGACKLGVGSASDPAPPTPGTTNASNATAGGSSTAGATDATGTTGTSDPTGTTSPDTTGADTEPDTTGSST